MSCVFCRDVHESGEIVYENDDAWVVLHPDWAVRGHAMVVAKRHVEDVSNLAEAEWERLSALYRDAERVLLRAAKADRAIILKLGLATPHLHLHIYPVGAELERAAVMRAIDGLTRIERDDMFVEDVRRELQIRDYEPLTRPRST